jgi:cytochrome c556
LGPTIIFYLNFKEKIMLKNKSTIFCGVTITLLLAVIGVMVVNFLVLGKTEEGVDGRTAILLEEGERVRVLGEMREFLSAVQIITTAAANEDMDTIAKTARSVGGANVEMMAPSMIAKLPLEFKTLGFSIHDDFDEIAKDAEELKDPQHTLEQLGAAMGKCVACHNIYQLKVEP